MIRRLQIFSDGWLEPLAPDLVAARFLRPKRLLADADWNGGWVAASPATANHRMRANAFRSAAGRRRYCAGLLLRHGLPPATTLQLTAARVDAAGCRQSRECGLRVTVMVSAGVKTNPVWAGDPASYDEVAERDYAPLPVGTINTAVYIDARLADPVLAHVFTVVAEVKADVLRAAGVVSRYSSRHATGTGTDSTTVVADPAALRGLTTASTHSRLGMVIAQATRAALTTALRNERRHAG